jgi:hypothetical protein
VVLVSRSPSSQPRAAELGALVLAAPVTGPRLTATVARLLRSAGSAPPG